MVRQRDAMTRWDDQFRARPKTKAPRRGWLLAELSALTGLGKRTLRHYLECGVLPPPDFRGVATRYQRVHLLRLVALMHWQKTQELSLGEIKRRLDAVPAAELEAFVWQLPLSEPLLALLHQSDPFGGSRPPPELAQAKPLPDPDAKAAPLGVEPPLRGGALWCRIPLLPGLELLLDTGASPVVMRLAREVQAQFAGRPVAELQAQTES